jgi:prepilin-type N-terminal cleavage/methylation domain-containing protein
MRAPPLFRLSPSTSPPARARSERTIDAGFTLTELMIVVAIMGIMSAIATPLLTRDNQVDAGRAFSSALGRELQKCRSEAVSSRLGVRAFVFSDRVELRSYKAGATVGAAPVAPTTADPLLGSVKAKEGVVILNVVAPTDTAPTDEVLTTTKSAIIDFLSRGGTQLVGAPIPTSSVVYIKNKNLPSGTEFSAFRIDIAAVTAFVSVRTR